MKQNSKGAKTMKFPKIEWRRKLTQVEQMMKEQHEYSIMCDRMHGTYSAEEIYKFGYDVLHFDDYSFEFAEDGIVLKKFLCEAEEVFVPRSYQNKYVTELNGTFENSSIVSVHLPSSLRRLEQAFCRCELLAEIEIPKETEYISSLEFRHCRALERIDVVPQNEHFYSVDGVLFERESKMLLKYPEGKKGQTYIIPEGTERICAFALKDCRHLKKIILPSSLKIIDGGAFSSGCRIECIEVAEGNKSFSIENGALVSYGCDEAVGESWQKIIFTPKSR